MIKIDLHIHSKASSYKESIFIDTPGMRELGNFEIENGLNLTFDDFSEYASRCHFKK